MFVYNNCISFLTSKVIGLDLQVGDKSSKRW